MTRALDEHLGMLHEAIAKTLLAKVVSGEASAAEMQAAIKFLKDNNITATIEQSVDMGKLADYALPTFPDDADEEYAVN